jgi:hypothetical protein
VIHGGEVAAPWARTAVLAVVRGALEGEHGHDQGGALGDEVADVGEHFCSRTSSYPSTRRLARAFY